MDELQSITFNMSNSGHKRKLTSLLPTGGPLTKKVKTSLPKGQYEHSPPLSVGDNDIFFKSDSGRNGYAFLSNYWPFVTEAAAKGVLHHHGIVADKSKPLFEVDGRSYCSVEHFYQSARQPASRPNVREAIRDAPDAITAKKLNNQYKKKWPSLLSSTEERELMLTGLRCKFVQNEQLGELLLATGSRALHEGAGMGAGSNKWVLTKDGSKGGDLLGQLLMQVRQELLEGRDQKSD